MINSNAILEINTKNLIYNYKSLSKIAKNSLTAVTIKANAYGIGDIKGFKIFYKIGCRHFFLATIEEAIRIRKLNKKCNIYVLNGLESNEIAIYNRLNIIPILNSIEEINKIINSKFFNTKFRFGIHIDTGLNRLGIKIDDIPKKKFKNINLEIIISHLASADEIKNRYSLIQNKKFKEAFKYFKSIKYKSISNSAGILNNECFHYDIVRPGIALYGGYYNINLRNNMKLKSVVTFKGKILQIKTIDRNEFVGYNQTFKTKKRITIAIIGLGYADGMSRRLSNTGNVYFKDETYKVIGRVSMDSITVDISKSKYQIKCGQYMEFINKNNNIQKLAKKCGTISNEILTSISKRVKREYI